MYTADEAVVELQQIKAGRPKKRQGPAFAAQGQFLPFSANKTIKQKKTKGKISKQSEPLHKPEFDLRPAVITSRKRPVIPQVIETI
jgi:hypothetical protein